jgi:hypothetical protein
MQRLAVGGGSTAGLLGNRDYTATGPPPHSCGIEKEGFSRSIRPKMRPFSGCRINMVSFPY